MMKKMAWLRGIDISDYQRGLNLDKIDYDFVICKATEGTSIIHDTCDPFIQKAIKSGKLWGFYHFLNREDPIKQADYFVKNCSNYFGQGIPVLDFEMYGTVHGSSGAKKFLDRVYELTKVRCVIYMSRSVCTQFDWSAVAKNNGLWVAQYANNSATGYQSDPWLPDGSFGAWSTVTMHQYTSHGRLSGYNGNLDLDIAYLTADAWKRIAQGDRNGSSGTPSKPAEEQKPSVQQIAVDGYWGSDTTKRLQQTFGTVVDGEVWHQYKPNAQAAFTSGWKYDNTLEGSPLIKAMQKKLGVSADGIIGKDTINALIKRYMATSGASVLDGKLDAGSMTVKAMQKALNNGSF